MTAAYFEGRQMKHTPCQLPLCNLVQGWPPLSCGISHGRQDGQFNWTFAVIKYHIRPNQLKDRSTRWATFLADYLTWLHWRNCTLRPSQPITLSVNELKQQLLSCWLMVLLCPWLLCKLHCCLLLLLRAAPVPAAISSSQQLGAAVLQTGQPAQWPLCQQHSSISKGCDFWTLYLVSLKLQPRSVWGAAAAARCLGGCCCCCCCTCSSHPALLSPP